MIIPELVSSRQKGGIGSGPAEPFALGMVKVLGHRGLIACERLMGVILVVLSVQMLLDSISNYLKQTPLAHSNSPVAVTGETEPAGAAPAVRWWVAVPPAVLYQWPFLTTL